MAGERPNEDEPLIRRNVPKPRSRLSVEITRREPLGGDEHRPDRESFSPSPMSPAETPIRRKRRASEESELDTTGERSRFLPPSVYLKSLSYHEGKLRECRICLEAGEPRSRYAALCRGRIDDVMCRFPHMTQEEVDAAIAYREEEEASVDASKTPEARTKKRTKLAPRVSEVITEIPTSWRPRPGDERYSMAPHRVRGGAFKRCKLCVVAGGVREKRSMFCMGRSGHGKCAFEFEDPSGSSGDEDETPEQAAIKQMEHRLLRAQNARMSNVSRALRKEEVPAAPLRKSTTPYVSYRQQSTRPGLPATRGPSKAPEGEELNPRAPNGRLKPRCGPCLRAGGERAERAFLCPGSGRPKYCEYAPGAATPAALPSPAGAGVVDEKEPLVEMDAAPASEVTADAPAPITPAKRSPKLSPHGTPSSGKKPNLPSAKKGAPGSGKPKPRVKKRPRNSRLGKEESSAEDYETEESELSLELADSDESPDSSASEDERHERRVRYNRESTGYTIQGSDEEFHDALDLNAPPDDANVADDEGGIDESMETDEPVDPQVLKNVAAGMSDFVPRPNTNKYAPYLSFSEGGDGWATCVLCEAAGGSRTECAMWCYGRDGDGLCRLGPSSAPPETASPRSRRDSQRMFSPDERVFSPEHSPDPLASDIEMDDVSPIGEQPDGEGDCEGEGDGGLESGLEGGDGRFDAEPAPGADGSFDAELASAIQRSTITHSPPAFGLKPASQPSRTSSQSPQPRIRLNGTHPPSTQYRDPAAFVASSDPAPSSSPRSAVSYASPLPRAADSLQAALARSIRRDFLAPSSPRQTQQT